MRIANDGAALVLERGMVRHALTAERLRVRHYYMLLASMRDRKAKGSCRRKLDASLGRAAELALVLIDMGEAIPMCGAGSEFDDRVLAAMDALAKSRRHRGRAVARRSVRTDGTSQRVDPVASWRNEQAAGDSPSLGM